MLQIEMLKIGDKTIQGIHIASPGGKGHPHMLILLAEKGYIMCGYLNREAAENFGDAAVVISGSTFEEILENPVKAVTREASDLGIKIGMTGREAAERLV